MVILRECDDEGRTVHKSSEERKRLWDGYMQMLEGSLGVDEYRQIMDKVYSDVLSSESDFDSDSSGSVEILMETAAPFDLEVMNHKNSVADDLDIARLRSLRTISSTGSEDDVILESCGPKERVCILRPKSVSEEFFYFYPSILEDFNIRIPFTDFEVDVLRTINIAPSQLHPNSWAFMKAFERICEVLYIVPTIGLFFSFFEVKGVDNRSWVQVSGIPTRSFLQVYSSNYKNYKDRFVRVRGGSSCPQVLYASDGHPRFPHYWTKNPLSITGFNYDKLSSS